MEGKIAAAEWLKQGKGFGKMILLAVVGIVLILVGGQAGHLKSSDTKEADMDPYALVRSYTEEMERRIASLCEQIDGVSKAHVLLSLEGSTEQVYAENKSGSSADYVIIEGKDGDSTVPVQQIYPKIRGVAVVCTRGNDSEIRRTVTELLAAALGIPTSRIQVAGM